MAKSDLFYYSEKSAASDFTHEPQGHFVVERFVKGQPCWQKLVPANTRKPQSLIITDWRSMNWGVPRLKRIGLMIQQLLNEDFPVYLWQSGTLLKLEQENADDIRNLHVREKLIPTSYNEIITVAMKELGQTRDQIRILDDHWINYLTSAEQVPPPRNINIFSSHQPNIDQTHLLALIEEAQPKLEQVIYSEFSKEFIDKSRWILAELFKRFPNLEVVDKLDRLTLEPGWAELLLERNQLVYEGKSFDFSQLDGVRVLDLSNADVTKETLQFLLSKSKRLIEFNLPRKPPENFTQGIHLPQFEILNAKDNLMCKEDLQNLLSSSSKLWKIDVTDCPAFDEDLTGDFDFPLLKVLMANPRSSRNLNKILQGAPALEALYMSDTQTPPANFTSGIQLPALENLEIRAKIPMDDLQNLIKQSTKIKTLSVKPCNDTDDFTVDFDLPNLNLLIVFGGISAHNLRALLTKRERLHAVHFCQGKLPYNSAALLSQLPIKILSILSMVIHVKDIQEILTHATSITTLNLKGTQITNFEELKLEQDLPNITKLIVTGTNINLDSLRVFLTRMPNLEVLEIANCKHIYDIRIDRQIAILLRKIPKLTGFSFYLPSSVLGQKRTRQEAELSESNPQPKRPKITPPCSPDHDPVKYRNHRPISNDFRFKFKGENKNLDQSMIIEKLSHFLILTRHPDATLVSKLQNGMCLALTHLFMSVSPVLWSETLQTCRAWSGKLNTLDPNKLVPFFTQLLAAYKEFYITKIKPPNYFIGNNLDKFFSTQPIPNKIIFTNPWHAVAVMYFEGYWYVNDPNFLDGIKRCKQDIVSVLKKSLGNLICVEGVPHFDFTPIADSDAFIRDGGVLSLCSDVLNTKKLLNQLSKSPQPSPDALSGLLLRSTEGKPAWVMAITKPMVASYGLGLLESFIECNPNNWQSQLVNSIEILTPLERDQYITALQIWRNEYPELINALVKVFSTQSEQINYEKHFKTWQKITPTSMSVTEYCQTLFQGEKKQLVELSSQSDVYFLHLNLEIFCQKTSRPVFYVDTPDELMCSAPFIKRDGDVGVLKQGPGGLLHDFLMKHAGSNPPPVLIINYANFMPDDIVRFNSLLDEVRKADGTLLPESAFVIGLVRPNKSDSYQGEDFYSRVDRISPCPISGNKLSTEVPPLPIINKTEKTAPINLYMAADWEARLLGKWVIKKDLLCFEEGALVKALRTGLPIEIQNGLWNDFKFHRFWHLAQLRGKIEHAGRIITIPPTLQLVTMSGYDWENLKTGVEFRQGLTENADVLNPTRFNQFFTQYACDHEAKTLDTLPGLIASKANQTLTVNVTRSLTMNEWAMILETCKKNNVQLICHCASGIILPKPLETHFMEWEGEGQLPSSVGLIIESSDVDVTVDKFMQGEEEWQVLDISECQASHLLTKLQGKLNKETLRFQFTQEDQALLKALASNKNILLKGTFSAELADSLAPLLLEKRPNVYSQLVIVSEDASGFDYLPVYKDSVDMAAKRDYLLKSFTEDEVNSLENIEQESSTKLAARLRYQRSHPKQPTDNAWRGLDSLPATIKFDEFDGENSEAKAAIFVTKRLNEVNSILEHSPFVVLTGVTAAGKSTLVEKDLVRTCSSLHRGESSVRDWAMDRTPGRKLLFIDEANLGNRDWTEFEGLFNKPPGILIEGQYYPLTPDHKVVFGLNPADYGAGRNLPALFSRHGNAVVFNPLSQEFIYEKLLKPIFYNTALQGHSLNIAKELLAVYRFLCECTKQETLISPREVQMMALLTLSFHDRNKDADPILAAKHYAYQLGKTLVPPQHQAKFDQAFAQKEPLTKAVKNIPNFLITPSRAAISTLLDDLLALRERRRTNAGNEAQLFGGLGGLVLEGEPGLGKSELVVQKLVAAGYQQVGLNDQVVPEKAFYIMPVSMQLKDKKRLLRKAFEEGAVVVVDEINSSYMMGRLLNDLLMGKNAKGERPANPGFMLIGTQNPVTMEGRSKTSTDLARRLLTVSLPPYSEQEMVSILLSKGVLPDTATELVTAYQKQREIAEENHYKPGPVFRDLLKVAKQVVKAQSSMKKPLEALPIDHLKSPPMISIVDLLKHSFLNGEPRLSQTGEYIAGPSCG